jgi:hypothetical protein
VRTAEWRGRRACFPARDRKGKEWWVPRYREWKSGSLYRGDGEKFLVHGEKKEAYWGSVGDDFILYMTIFSIGEGIGTLLKLL